MIAITRNPSLRALCGVLFLVLALGCRRGPAPVGNRGVRQDLAGLERKLSPNLPVVSARWYELDKAKITGAPSAETVLYAFLVLDERGWQRLKNAALSRTGTVALPSDIAPKLLPADIQSTPAPGNGVTVAGPLYDVSSLSTAHYSATLGVRVGSALLLTLTSR